MESRVDVVIVSAFLRGQFLAERLLEEGLSVALIDVTQSLGSWDPEDWEGPFGVFKSPGFETAEWDYLASQDPIVAADRGLSLWLDKGPLELRGPLTDYAFGQRQVSSECVNLVKDLDKGPDEAAAGQFQFLKSRPFSEVWLASLAQQYAANTHYSNATAVGQARATPIFSPLYVRRVGARSLGQGFFRATQKGVKVYSPAQIVDLSLHGRALDGVEISSERSGVISGRKFIWMLSSEETKHCSARITELLYPKGAVESEWSWMRFRLEWHGTDLIEILPLKFVTVSDLNLPWTHGNFVSYQRCLNTSEVDAWVRIPTLQRGEKGYLEKIYAEIVQDLESRVPGIDVRVVQMPREFDHELSELGPPRHPIFSPQKLARQRRSNLKNLYFVGPDDWSGLDWTAQFMAERPVIDELVVWSQKEKQKRGASVDTTLHPG